MQLDSDEEDARQSIAAEITNNPRQIYENDAPDMKSENNSSYSYPMNLEFFKSEDIQKKLEAINDYLGPHHMRITIEENPGKVLAILNQIVQDPINSGREELLPFHTVNIKVGKNNLSDTLNKRLIEKRLQKIKDLAIQIKHLQEKKLNQEIKEFKKNIPFTQRFKFTAQHRIKPSIEDGVAHHVADTLMLPLIKGIESLKELSSGLSAQEHTMVELIQSINKEESFLKNLVAVKQFHNKLRKAALSNETKNSDATVEENFIKHFENATQY
jgi:hypothetical protein